MKIKKIDWFLIFETLLSVLSVVGLIFWILFSAQAINLMTDENLVVFLFGCCFIYVMMSRGFVYVPQIIRRKINKQDMPLSHTFYKKFYDIEETDDYLRLKLKEDRDE